MVRSVLPTHFCPFCGDGVWNESKTARFLQNPLMNLRAWPLGGACCTRTRLITLLKILARERGEPRPAVLEKCDPTESIWSREFTLMDPIAEGQLSTRITASRGRYCLCHVKAPESASKSFEERFEAFLSATRTQAEGVRNEKLQYPQPKLPPEPAARAPSLTSALKRRS